MPSMIAPKWKADMELQISRILAYHDHDINVTTSFLKAIQWLICELASKEIPFRVINLGAGVKKITTEVDVCPKCHGTGKC